MIDASFISLRWSRLPRPESGEFTVSPVVPTGLGDSYLAVDAVGHRHLLVPTGDYKAIEDSVGPALHVRGRTTSLHGDDYTSFLDIGCVNAEFYEVFDQLLADVVTRVDKATDPSNVALLCLTEWRYLFRPGDRRTLSPAQRIGLFAELGVLEDILEQELASDAVCWTGPTKDPHDFELADCSIEVKGYGAGSEMVTFHGVSQLECVDDKPLYLDLRCVEESPDGRSLVEIASDIEARIPEQAAFRTALNKLGLVDGDPILSRIRYTVTHESIFEVTDQTPRIVNSSFVAGAIPEGLRKLRYSASPTELITGTAYPTIAEWKVRR